MSRYLKILQVNHTDLLGGAAKIAFELFSFLAKKGHRSSFIVNKKSSNSDGVYQLRRTAWENLCFGLADCVPKIRGLGRLELFLKYLARPENYFSDKFGLENFGYPASKKLLKAYDLGIPDLINFHNLHGGYFDLRLLSTFSNKIPTIITLHDSWLLGGHCLHSMDCMRWQIGCGSCPDISLAHTITRDSTAYNCKRKAKIYSRSKLYVVTPSAWLMDKVNKSILGRSMLGAKVINNGVDLNIFKPSNKRLIREKLGLPNEAIVLLFVAHGARKSPWKDYETFKNVLAAVGEVFRYRSVMGVCLGDKGSTEFIGRAQIIFVGYENDPLKVAQYYQAADLYIHATKVDTFPNSILESLACGTPVIATAVCGIPEQIKSIKEFGVSNATGDLVGLSDVDGIVRSVKLILEKEDFYENLSKNAVKDAFVRFDLAKQIDRYLDFYYETIKHFKSQQIINGNAK